MFKIGVHVANCGEMLEANQRMSVIAEDAKMAKAQREKAKAESKEELAFYYFNKWKQDGRKVCDMNVNPKLNKDGAVSIVKVLMPKIAPEEKVGKYTSMGKCVEWLGKVARGTTWDSEMDKLEADWLAKQGEKARSTKRLF